MKFLLGNGLFGFGMTYLSKLTFAIAKRFIAVVFLAVAEKIISKRQVSVFSFVVT